MGKVMDEIWGAFSLGFVFGAFTSMLMIFITVVDPQIAECKRENTLTAQQ